MTTNQTTDETPKVEVCSICNGDYVGFGNNSWPINPGRCCDDCNQIVVNHRLRNLPRRRGAYAYPDWCNHEFLDELKGYLKKLDKQQTKALAASIQPTQPVQ